MMPKIKILAVIILVAFILTFLTPFQSIAQDEGKELENKLEETQSKIKELESKLQEVQATASSLTQQIVYMDNQIEITELRIIAQQEEIARLVREIDLLSSKIGILDENLDQVSDLLLERIRHTYKQGNRGVLDLFLNSSGEFNDTQAKVKYLQMVQVHDRKLLIAMQQAKSNYEQQKDLKEQKQIELDEARLELENQRIALDQQKDVKEALLTATRNDEKRFQELLASARAEQNAIQNAIASLVNRLVDGTPIDQGAQIAIMGNSGAAGGCSTGPHLHFEVTNKDGVHQNPSNYLKSGWSIEWDNDPDGQFSLGGSWDWPMKNPRITQGYGYTWWANTGFYNGRPHTGIDMVDDSDPVIRSPLAGTLYKGAASCRGSAMNYVAVEHDDVITWYWHVK